MNFFYNEIFYNVIFTMKIFYNEIFNNEIFYNEIFLQQKCIFLYENFNFAGKIWHVKKTYIVKIKNTVKKCSSNLP